MNFFLLTKDANSGLQKITDTTYKTFMERINKCEVFIK